AALARLDIGEVDALGGQQGPVDPALIMRDVDALARIEAVGGVPIGRVEPGEQRTEQQHRRRAAHDPGEAAAAPHPARAAAPSCESIVVDICLMWSTQIKVNRRRAVSKSTSTLPARHSFSNSAPSLWSARRAMSIAS